MALIDDVKTALRVTSSDIDGEIQDLIDAAKADIALAGIDIERVTEADPLIKRAIVVFCKANFDTDTQEADRLQRSYDLLKAHLASAVDYLPLPVTG